MGGGWRLNVTDPSGSFSDHVAGPDGAWRLTKDMLTLYSNNHENRDTQGHMSAGSTLTYQSLIAINLTASGAIANGLELRPELDEASGRWRVRAEGPTRSGARLTFAAEGSWDPQAKVGTFARAEVEAHDAKAGTVKGEHYLAKEWKYVPELSLMVASRIEQSNEQGLPVQIHVLVEASPFTPAQFERLVREPTPTTVDPSRGSLTYRSISDLRGPSEAVSQKNDAGEFVPQNAEAVRRQRNDTIVRVIGYVAAGIIVAAILALRLSRARRSRVTKEALQ